MTYNIDYETDKKLDLPYEEIIKQVVDASLDHEECPYEVEVNVLLTDNEAIHEMNQEYRDVDRATDVLSFPMAEYETPGDFSHLEEDPDCFHPETGELLLGDIVLSVEKIQEQAKAYGHSEKRELAFLVAHSMLHLLGYDHMEEDERLEMEQRQREILDSIGITR